MTSLHALAADANARIATTNRAGEIEWIVTSAGLKLVYTERFEKENGMRIKSAMERERRNATRRQSEADAINRTGPDNQQDRYL